MYGPFTPSLSGDETRYASESEAQNILRRARGGQVHSDHRLHLDDAGGDLDETQAQSVELGDAGSSLSPTYSPARQDTSLSSKVLGPQRDRFAVRGAVCGRVPCIAVALEHILAGETLRCNCPLERSKPMMIVGFARVAIPGGLSALDFACDRLCSNMVVASPH
jgi:hypothetical protein